MKLHCIEKKKDEWFCKMVLTDFEKKFFAKFFQTMFSQAFDNSIEIVFIKTGATSLVAGNKNYVEGLVKIVDEILTNDYSGKATLSFLTEDMDVDNVLKIPAKYVLNAFIGLVLKATVENSEVRYLSHKEGGEKLIQADVWINKLIVESTSNVMSSMLQGFQQIKVVQ